MSMRSLVANIRHIGSSSSIISSERGSAPARAIFSETFNLLKPGIGGPGIISNLVSYTSEEIRTEDECKE
jgi:hypothetical protein